MAEKRLKLYIWECIFTDYFPGMAVALAYDVREAREAIAESQGYVASNWQRIVDELKSVEPEVIHLSGSRATKKIRAWAVHGGG